MNLKRERNQSSKKIIKIVIMGVAMAALMVFMIIRNYVQLRDALVSNEQKHLLTIAETTAKNIENRFKAEERSLRLLSKDSGFLEDFKSLEERSENYSGDAIKFYYKAASPGVESMQLLNSSGKVLAEYPSKVISTIYSNLSSLEDVHGVMRDPGFEISKVYFEGKVPFIYLLQPIGIDGRFRGMIRAKVSIGNIYDDFVKQIRSGKKGYASIKTSNGVFLMHPKKNQVGYKAMDLRRKILPNYDWNELEELFTEQRSGRSGTKIYHSVWVLDDKPKLVKKFNAYAPIKLQDDFWIVTLSTDYSEVVERIRKNYYSTIIISSMIVLSFIFVGVYIYIIKERKEKLKQETSHLEEVKKLNTELEEDIEKRKLLEKKLLKTMDENKKKELIMIHQSRHAAMGEMIGNIAHQWRQPLSSLSLLISNLEDIILYGEDDKEYIDDVFKRSRVIINKMSETIDDFRYFFKPKAEKEKFNLYKLVNLTKSICGERLRHHDIDLKLEFAEEIEFVGYFNQLSQVILNLVNNAVDALIENKKNNREITLMAKQSKEKEVTIFIRDNGGGIPKEVLKNIFDPYFSTKSEKNGTGLGLHMSKMIIEKNFNGSITVENYDEGAIFKIVIPQE